MDGGESQEYFNYVRLKVLVATVGDKILRQLFRDGYQEKLKKKWDNPSAPAAAELSNAFGPSNLNIKDNQKTAFQTGDIYKWDSTLLLQLLRHTLPSKDQQLKSKELKELQELRNTIEHLPSSSLTDEVYKALWKRSEDTLLALGASQKEIEHIKTTSKLEGLEFKSDQIDQTNMDEAKKLREQGKALVGSDFENGMQFFARALLLFGLSPQEKAVLCCSQCQGYFSQFEHHEALPEDTMKMYVLSAESDARSAIDLQPEGWEGYFCLGKVLQFQSLWKFAIEAFEHAMSLIQDNDDSSSYQEARNARDECRWDLTDHSTLHLDPLLAPLGDTELLRHLTKSRLKEFSHNNHRTKSKEQILFMERNVKSPDLKIKADASVFLAHRHLLGDHFPLNEKKAAELFKSADALENAEAAYNLGMLYLLGSGVNRSIPNAIEYFEKAAKYPITDDVVHYKGEAIENDLVITISRDVGKAEAKFMLGKCYFDGIGKPVEHFTAAELFAKASVEGCGQASHNLGHCYDTGLGVREDPARALQYLKLAVDQHCPITMYDLSRAYLKRGDLLQAQIWFSRSLASRNAHAVMKEPEFNLQLQALLQHQERFKANIPEDVQRLGIPVHNLIPALKATSIPEFLEIKEAVYNHWEPQRLSKNSAKFSNCLSHLPEICKRAKTGNVYSHIISIALSAYDIGCTILCSLLEDWDFVSEELQAERKLLLLAHMAKYFALAGYIASVPANYRETLQEIAIKMLSEEAQSQTDLDARIVLAHLTVSNNMDAESSGYQYPYEEVLELLEECERLYSDEEPYFYILHSEFLASLWYHDLGLEITLEALDSFPENPDLLYSKARHEHHLPEPPSVGYDVSSRIKAWQTFISKAPEDHRRIPEAYYSMAMVAASDGDRDKFIVYHLRGVETENNLLPCFLPYQCLSKDFCEPLFKHYCTRSEVSFPTRWMALLKNDVPNQLKEEHYQLQLTNPKRKAVTVKVRKALLKTLKHWREAKAKGQGLNFYMGQGDVIQRAPSQEDAPPLRDVLFEDMDPSEDCVYQGTGINLVLMEELIIFPHIPSIRSVVKDDKDDFQRIYFYNMDRKDGGLRRKLGFGSRIRLLNPYHRLTQDKGLGIRVDDPASIEFLQSGEDRPICRYCWKENPEKRCSRCKTAYYCDKECQKLDWTCLEHKSICEVMLAAPDLEKEIHSTHS